MPFESLIPVSGTIMNISRGGSCCSHMAALRTENGTVNFFIDSSTFVIDSVQLRAGMRITAFYDSSLPVPLIFPPQYHAQMAAVTGRNEQVSFQFFNRNLLAADRSLQLNISDQTVVQTGSGLTAVRGISICLFFIRQRQGAYRLRQHRGGLSYFAKEDWV